MKAFLAVLVLLLSAWGFGPYLFSGEVTVRGLASPEPAPQTEVTASPEPAPSAEAVFLPGSDSPIFPEPPRPSGARKARRTPLPARDGALSCLGPLCYRGRI